MPWKFVSDLKLHEVLQTLIRLITKENASCIIDSFWQAADHQAHIALSEPMSNVDQLGSSLGLFLTFPPLPTLINLRAIDIVSSIDWWETLANREC